MRSAFVSPSFLVSDSSGGSGGGAQAVFEMRGGAQGGVKPPKCAKDPGIYAF